MLDHMKKLEGNTENWSISDIREFKLGLVVSSRSIGSSRAAETSKAGELYA
jgi:hypothetical protein